MDTIVVGGGISGLRTAQLLKQQGKKVLVLEANDRVGGRTKGKIVGTTQYDIGGQWIGPTQDRMYRIVKELGLEISPQYIKGIPYQFINNKLYRSLTQDIPGCLPYLQLPLLGFILFYIDYLSWQVPKDEPWKAKRAEEWDSYSLETWMRNSWWCPTKATKTAVELIAWALLSTEPSRVSFLWFLWFVRASGGINFLISTHGGAQQDKIKGGAVRVSQLLAEQLGDSVLLSSPVARISQSDDGCSVVTESGEVYHSAKVVIACSPTMAARIKYDPPMPGCRDALTQGYLMGHVIKTLTFYKDPFWKAKGLSGEGVSDLSVRLTFDASFPDEGLHALVGFFLGDSALEWCDKSIDERKQEVVANFVKIFGDEARNPVDYIENNWCIEPYVRGAYMAIPPPNLLTKLGPALRTPIGNIHFAGTETAQHWSGYMEGALEAAERVVQELSLDSLPVSKNLFNQDRKVRSKMVDRSSGNISLWKFTFAVGAIAAVAYYFVSP